jgi:hypothetical protein
LFNANSPIFQLNHGENKLIFSNRISGVMVSVFVSITVDYGFEAQSGETKDYEIGNCCFSAKHAALKRKSKGWLAQNLDNVSVEKYVIYLYKL